MSDIKEIKPHLNGAEYIIEDVPAPPTPKNRPSAILFNWMIESIKQLKPSKVYVGTFTNGWGGDVQYGKVGNMVVVHGRLTGGAHGQTAFIIPDGYKPSMESRQPTTGGNTLTIYSSGGVVISGSTTGNVNYFSLTYLI